MELAFHIILAVLGVGLAFCLLVTYLISEELRKIALRLVIRLEELEREARQKEKYQEEIKRANERMMESIQANVNKWIQDKSTLNVKESPLDFPPTKKED